MRKTMKVREWSEDYRGWQLKFKIRARKRDGHLKAGVYVRKKFLFGLVPGGGVRYKETGDKWVIGEEALDEQVADLRKGAKGFVDNIETAKNISGGLSDNNT